MGQGTTAFQQNILFYFYLSKAPHVAPDWSQPKTAGQQMGAETTCSLPAGGSQASEPQSTASPRGCADSAGRQVAGKVVTRQPAGTGSQAEPLQQSSFLRRQTSRPVRSCLFHTFLGAVAGMKQGHPLPSGQGRRYKLLYTRSSNVEGGLVWVNGTVSSGVSDAGRPCSLGTRATFPGSRTTQPTRTFCLHAVSSCQRSAGLSRLGPSRGLHSDALFNA